MKSSDFVLDRVVSGHLAEVVCPKCNKRNTTAEKVCECGENLLVMEFTQKENLYDRVCEEIDTNPEIQEIIQEGIRKYFDSLVRVEDMNLSDMSCFTIGED